MDKPATQVKRIRDKGGKFVKGVSGNPKGPEPVQLRKSYAIKNFLLDFFKEKHINTKRFEAWCDRERNLEKFYGWIMNMMPKEMDMKAEGFGQTKIVIVRAGQEKTLKDKENPPQSREEVLKNV